MASSSKTSFDPSAPRTGKSLFEQKETRDPKDTQKDTVFVSTSTIPQRETQTPRDMDINIQAAVDAAVGRQISQLQRTITESVTASVMTQMESMMIKVLTDNGFKQPNTGKSVRFETPSVETSSNGQEQLNKKQDKDEAIPDQPDTSKSDAPKSDIRHRKSSLKANNSGYPDDEDPDDSGYSSQSYGYNSGYSSQSRGSPKLKPKDLSYFDPMHGDGTQAVYTTSSGDVIHTDIYAWTDNLISTAEEYSYEEVLSTWPKALRGSAFEWYTYDLDADYKASLKFYSLADIQEMLLDSFKVELPQVITDLEKSEYTLHDVRKGYHVVRFARHVMSLARNAGFNESGQVMYAYMKLHPTLVQPHILQPDHWTTRRAFITELNRKWFRLNSSAKYRNDQGKAIDAKSNNYQQQQQQQQYQQHQRPRQSIEPRRSHTPYGNRNFDNNRPRDDIVKPTRDTPFVKQERSSPTNPYMANNADATLANATLTIGNYADIDNSESEEE